MRGGTPHLRTLNPETGSIISVANSIIGHDISLSTWQSVYTTHVVKTRVANSSDGADNPAIPTYFLNYDGAAQGLGIPCASITAPPNSTLITYTFDAKLPQSVGSSRILYGILDGAGAGFISPSPATITLTSNWQTLVTSASVTPGLEYRICFKCNDTTNAPTTTAQAQALIRNLKVSVSASSGFFSGTFTGIEFSPDNLHDGGNTAVTTVQYTNQIVSWTNPALSRMGLSIDGIVSPISAVLELYAADSSDVRLSTGIMQGSDPGSVQYLTDSGIGSIANGQASFPTMSLGTGRFIDFVMGSTANNYSLYISPKRIYLQGSGYSIKRAAKPLHSIIFIGDSIYCGYMASPSHLYGWPSKFRNMLPRTTAAIFIASSGETLNMIASSSTQITAFTTTASMYGVGSGQTYVIELGTNDYGTNAQSASIYGTQLGNFVDALHVSDSLGLVILQTPFSRSNENIVNGSGNTLENYRAQMRIVASIRPWCKVIEGPTIFPSIPTFGDGIHPGNNDGTSIAQGIFKALVSSSVPGLF